MKHLFWIYIFSYFLSHVYCVPIHLNLFYSLTNVFLFNVPYVPCSIRLERINELWTLNFEISYDQWLRDHTNLPFVLKPMHNVNNVFTVSKCINFAKLKIFIILHSYALKWHLIFTHWLIWVSLCEHQNFMYTL